MVRIQRGTIDPAELEAVVSRPGAGAVLTFSGVTRDNFGGRPVLGLEYEAYPDMAEAELGRIEAEALARWPEVRLALVHRLGHLAVGEASVVVSVSAPHRDAAYAASRFAIDTLKARVPIWKKELYADGSAWKENAEFSAAELAGAAAPAASPPSREDVGPEDA